MKHYKGTYYKLQLRKFSSSENKVTAKYIFQKLLELMVAKSLWICKIRKISYEELLKRYYSLAFVLSLRHALKSIVV